MTKPEPSEEEEADRQGTEEERKKLADEIKGKTGPDRDKQVRQKWNVEGHGDLYFRPNSGEMCL